MRATARAFPWWLGWLLFAVLCVVAYHPSIHGGFLWDDNGHVTKPELQSLSGLARIWFEPGASQQYYPVLHSAFWFEHKLWGDAALGYHWLSIFLHATAAALLVRVLQRLAIRGAWLAGLIFALHPVCVESVAWISEQKNTLSAVFYLLAALAYLRFDEYRGDGTAVTNPATTRRAWRFYALASLLFVLAVLTKTVTATLPGALLVIAWWRRGDVSWRRDIAPVLPWFAVGIVAGLGTVWVERNLIGAQGAAYSLDLWHRGMLAGNVVWFYFGKLLWPANLAFVYPRWPVETWSAANSVAGFAALGVLVVLWMIRRRTRGPLAGALYFIGTLFPALGFFNVFPFIYSYVADHFQYLACIGAIVPIAAGSVAALAKIPGWWARAIPAALVAVLGFSTWQQAHDYRDNLTLYRATLARNPEAWMASYNLGMELAARGQIDAAVASYHDALRVRPGYAEVHANLAMALFTQPGHLDEVVEHLQTAVRLSPDLWQARLNLGNILASIPGREDQAIEQYRAVLKQRPIDSEVYVNLALVLRNRPGHRGEAIQLLKTALRLKPELVEVKQLLDQMTY